MPRYRTGRLVAALIATFGWVTLLTGVAAALYFSQRGLVLATVPPRAAGILRNAPLWPLVLAGIGLALTGLMGVAGGQLLRAVLDTAANSLAIREALVPHSGEAEAGGTAASGSDRQEGD